MKNIKFNLHSFIDVITNSSTQIFVIGGNGTKDYIYELINQFLKQFNSINTAEEMFDIGFTNPNCENDEVLLKYYIGSQILTDEFKPYPYQEDEDYFEYEKNDETWEISVDNYFSEKVQEYYKKHKVQLNEKLLNNSIIITSPIQFQRDDEYHSIDITVEPKEGFQNMAEVARLLNKMSGVFEIGGING